MGGSREAGVGGADLTELAVNRSLDREIAAETAPVSRDAWLDALRSVSILRVVILHTFARFGEATVVPLSFVLPGMPIVFAVSGAVCYSALCRSPAASEAPHPKHPGVHASFYRERARRLLTPFWTYAAVLLILLFSSVARSDHPWYAFDPSATWRWVLPIVEPTASEAWKHLALHLWFMPPFLWILAAAPLLVALHRRAPGLGLGVVSIAAAWVELPQLDAPSALRNVLVYAIAFQVGFFLRDSRFSTPRAPLLLGMTVAGAACGVWIHRDLAPGAMLNAVPLAHVVYGISMIPLWILCRRLVVALYTTRFVSALGHAVNRRAYTIFLWGPAANEIAWRIAMRGPSNHFDLIYLSLSALGVIAFAATLGIVEIASRRRPPRVPLPA